MKNNYRFDYLISFNFDVRCEYINFILNVDIQ